MAAGERLTAALLAQGRIVGVDKPKEWTSFDVVKKLRGAAGIKKVGHAGTLDPFATGLLLICFGPATRQVESLMALEKEYTGTIALGIETDTHDITGTVSRQEHVSAIDPSALEAALAPFRGTIMQIPPMFSALKHKGRRLYDYARKGETVDIEPRPVTIYAFDLLAVQGHEFEFKIVCSRGTYIRAIARDLGSALGTGAVLRSLTRTRIGSYLLEDAYQVAELAAQLKQSRAES